MWRGEQLELVYAFLLQFYKDLYSVGIFLQSLGYDNACKLLAVARKNQDRHLPWSKSFVEDVAIVLDNFHRRNHTWCLKNMPEVDPLGEKNAALLAGKNTEACEQLNSWINSRSRSALEMPPGRFMIYWWTLLVSHNEWLEAEAACMRRRFAKGGLQHDPDVPRRKSAKPTSQDV